MNKPKFVSPKGVAVFPKLNEPDTKFKAEGEYATKLAFDPNDKQVIAFIKKLEQVQKEMFQEFLAEKPGNKKFSLAPVYTEELDKEGEETGRILVNFKMKASGTSKRTGKQWTRSPAVFDSRGTRLENVPAIWGGSVLRVAAEAVPGPVPSSKLFYLSLRMNGVKVIELVTSGGQTADSLGFGDDEDGYEADDAALTKPAPAPAPFTDDEDDDDGDF